MQEIKYIDKDEFFDRGRKIYKRLKPKLEKTFNGKIIAIEVETGGYVIGENELEAAIKAKEKFPGKIFNFIRIGSKVLHRLRRVGS